MELKWKSNMTDTNPGNKADSLNFDALIAYMQHKSCVKSKDEERKAIKGLESLLDKSWSKETSNDPDNWSQTNKAYGQCAITALIVQEVFGGELMRTETLSSEKKVSHYYNKLPNGDIIDLTRKQFPEGTAFSEPQSRERSYVLSYLPTEKRYNLLKKLVLYQLQHLI